MFEDFKDKIRQHGNEKVESPPLPPEVIAKLQSQGLDPETGEITKALSSVGFASPPDWLKSYDCLSQGEKMRVDIARALCLDKQLIVFDEFIIVVDREIAKVSAFCN
jgi:ABC-type dipeptide/oligopeptide/nickel transport system ATPase subunit